MLEGERKGKQARNVGEDIVQVQRIILKAKNEVEAKRKGNKRGNNQLWVKRKCKTGKE